MIRYSWYYADRFEDSNGDYVLYADHEAAIKEKDGGCICQECGSLFREDVRLSDDLWNKIRPSGKSEGAGLLCGGCIGRKITEINADLLKKLEKAEGEIGRLSKMYIKDTMENVSVIADLRAKLAVAEKAIKLAIPCLEDWVETTGFGTVNKRDREALEALKEADDD